VEAAGLAQPSAAERRKGRAVRPKRRPGVEAQMNRGKMEKLPPVNKPAYRPLLSKTDRAAAGGSVSGSGSASKKGSESVSASGTASGSTSKKGSGSGSGSGSKKGSESGSGSGSGTTKR
jgi:hypothetical protein